MISTWQTNCSYSLGDYVTPISRNGYVYKCTQQGVSAAACSTAYTTGQDGFEAVYDDTQRCGQSLVAEASGRVFNIKLMLARVGFPGLVKIGLYNALLNVPYGDPLDSVVISGDELGESLAWVTLPMNCLVNATTPYAIIVSSPTSSFTTINHPIVGTDESSPSYAGGKLVFSKVAIGDESYNWSYDSFVDCLFEINVYPEPTWPTTVGQTVADGTVIWTCDHLANSIPTPKPRLTLLSYSDARLNLRNYSQPRLTLKGG